MLKPEFIKELKKTDVCENPEKTAERLRAAWKPLAAAEREEILSLTGLSKVSVARAYKTGGASAKLIAGMAQVLSIDPYYLAGKTDEQRPYDDALLVQFLTDLKYEVGKGDVVKRRQTRTKPETPAKPVEQPPVETPAEVSDKTESPAPAVKHAPGQIDLSVIANELSKLDNNRLDELTDEDIALMLKSLTVQAGFSEEKKNRLALIKSLLLI